MPAISRKAGKVRRLWCVVLAVALVVLGYGAGWMARARDVERQQRLRAMLAPYLSGCSSGFIIPAPKASMSPPEQRYAQKGAGAQAAEPAACRRATKPEDRT